MDKTQDCPDGSGEACDNAINRALIGKDVTMEGADNIVRSDNATDATLQCSLDVETSANTIEKVNNASIETSGNINIAVGSQNEAASCGQNQTSPTINAARTVSNPVNNNNAIDVTHTAQVSEFSEINTQAKIPAINSAIDDDQDASTTIDSTIKDNLGSLLVTGDHEANLQRRKTQCGPAHDGDPSLRQYEAVRNINEQIQSTQRANGSFNIAPHHTAVFTIPAGMHLYGHFPSMPQTLINTITNGQGVASGNVGTENLGGSSNNLPREANPFHGLQSVYVVDGPHMYSRATNESLGPNFIHRVQDGAILTRISGQSSGFPNFNGAQTFYLIPTDRLNVSCSPKKNVAVKQAFSPNRNWVSVTNGRSTETIQSTNFNQAHIQKVLNDLAGPVRDMSHGEYEGVTDPMPPVYERLEDDKPVKPSAMAKSPVHEQVNSPTQATDIVYLDQETGFYTYLRQFDDREADIFSLENLNKIIHGPETANSNSDNADETKLTDSHTTLAEQSSQESQKSNVPGPSQDVKSSQAAVDSQDNDDDASEEPARKKRRYDRRQFRYSAAALKEISFMPPKDGEPWPYGLFVPPAFTNSAGVRVINYNMKREHGGRPRKPLTNVSAEDIATRNFNMENKRASRDRDAVVKDLQDTRNHMRSVLVQHGAENFQKWLQISPYTSKPAASRNSAACYVDDRNIAAMKAAGVATGQYSGLPNGVSVPLDAVVDPNGEFTYGRYLIGARRIYNSPYALSGVNSTNQISGGAEE